MSRSTRLLATARIGASSVLLLLVAGVPLWGTWRLSDLRTLSVEQSQALTRRLRLRDELKESADTHEADALTKEIEGSLRRFPVGAQRHRLRVLLEMLAEENGATLTKLQLGDPIETPALEVPQMRALPFGATFEGSIPSLGSILKQFPHLERIIQIETIDISSESLQGDDAARAPRSNAMRASVQGCALFVTEPIVQKP
ncbi:MAG: hypothetical protein JNJ88_21470 [Planctomycetes bacterium]|nr:hypothetical protein [Planctomycetota bacterium]